MRRTLSESLALCALVLACEPAPQPHTAADSSSPNATMTQPAMMLDSILRLGELVPFQADAVSRATGLPLEEQPTGSNPYFTIYRSNGAGAGLFRSAELRLRNDASPGRDGLLIVDVAGADCVTRDDAITALGSPLKLVPASPNAPAQTPHYYVYARPWGQLRLGFARDERSCLVTAVLDATGS